MEVNLRKFYSAEDSTLLSECRICPRNCGADRFSGRAGYCGMDAGMNIATVCLHSGEEPPVSGPAGIVNIFFSGCNMRCVYCQNHEISSRKATGRKIYSDPSKVADAVCSCLNDDVNAVGFVSPSHMIPQFRLIVGLIKDRGYNPVIVYNTNGYDRAETIDEISGFTDIFLPDFKYVSESLSGSYSDTPGYPGVALKAIKRMYYHKGSKLLLDEKGRAVWGMLIRHLVLPGKVEESINVLRTIASELSPGVHISLMSQYHPTDAVYEHASLGRTLYRDEYAAVVQEMERLGFRNGYIQDPESCISYRPDFSRDHPFE